DLSPRSAGPGRARTRRSVISHTLSTGGGLVFQGTAPVSDSEGARCAPPALRGAVRPLHGAATHRAVHGWQAPLDLFRSVLCDAPGHRVPDHRHGPLARRPTR